MKKNCILGILFGLTTLIQSCKKSSTTEPIIQTINADVKVNQSYQLDLGSFSMEEDAGISKQATHFLASLLSRQSSGTFLISLTSIFLQQILLGKMKWSLQSQKPLME